MKKGLLVFTNTVPYPPVTGGRVRYYNLIKELSRRFDVYLLSLAGPGEAGLDTGPLREFAKEVRLVEFEKPRPTRLKKFLNLLDLHPADLNFECRQAKSALVEMIHGHPIHAVLVWTSFLASYVDLIPPGVTRILDLDDLQFVRVKRLVQEMPPGKRKLGYLPEVPKVRRFERKMLGKFHLALTCSSLDRDRVLDLAPRARVELLPNGVDTSFFNPAGFHEWGHPALVYTGGLGPQGGDGVLRFIREIYPLIRGRLPGVKLHLVGAGALDEIRQSAESDASIVLEGAVEDVRPYMAGGRVFVVPLWVASGTRLKILEAAAMERPVVTTSVGAEGLDFIDGREIFIADEKEAFASRCLELMGSPELREKMGKRARDKAESLYKWEAIGAGAANIIEELVG